MSRAKSGPRRGPQLPLALQQKLGLPENKKKPRTQIADRKQRRQNERRQQNGKPGPKPRPAVASREQDFHEEDEEDEEDDETEAEDGSELTHQEQAQSEHEEIIHANRHLSDDLDKRNRSIPKLHAKIAGSRSPSPSFDAEDGSDTLSRGSREYSPEVVLDANSRTFRDRQAEEDAEILALEKRLGISRNKNKNRVFDDGFDDLLEDLEDEVDSKKRKREEQEWLEQKRRKIPAHRQDNDITTDSEAGEMYEDDRDDEDADDDTDGGNSFAGFDEEIAEVEDTDADSAVALKQSPPKRVKENPYVAPVVDGVTAAKYVPPSRRKPPDTDSEKVERLRRQAQGHLNKLSEANIISIVDEFEKLYQTNPRQDVTDVLIDLVLTAFSIPSALQNTFIILHAAFIAAIYKLQGADLGAEVLSRLVESFNKYHNDPNALGKESLNLTGLLANLFTFGVVSSALVYDHVRLLLEDFGETNAELLLRVMRDCGPQLRADDPTALKAIVQMMNEVSASMTSSGITLSVRTRVMMDTITDLKNNKIRQATNSAGVTGEHLTRMRKALGGLNSRQLRATEPLGITRADILNSDKKGKWWLVGASWKGRDEQADGTQVSDQNRRTTRTEDDFTLQDNEVVDYPTLFAQYKLTSPVHRSIFVAITSATDGIDAIQRLAKLRLTRKQELEIPPIILRTCRAEPQFNPYYGVVGKMLLREKRYRMSFNIALWKFFESVGEKQDDDEFGGTEDTNDDEIRVTEIANIARLYAYLIAKQSLGLDVLKTLSIGFTKENTTIFLEMFFIALFSSKLKEDNIVEIFTTGIDAARSTSMTYFLNKNVRRSNLIGDKHQQKQVKRGVDMAVAALATLAMDAADLESDV